MTIVPLRVTQINRERSGDVRLAWDAVPGARYRVQFKHRLDAPSWTALPGDVAGDIEAVKSDNTATTAEQRFYKIILLD